MNKLRLKKLQAALRRPILIKKPENLAYLLGRKFLNAYLLIKKNQVVFLGDGLEKVVGIRHTDLLKNVGKYIKPRETLELFGEFTYNETAYIKLKNPKLKFRVSVKHSPVDMARRLKDKSELKKIKKSMEIVGAVFGLVKKQLRRQTWTEQALAGYIQKTGLKLGAEAVSFSAIVAAGENAAIPHHMPSKKRLKAGEPVILDFGFKYQGYCSDFTRTVFLKKATPKMASAYSQVEKAYLEAMAVARPGVLAGWVYDHAVKILSENKLDKYFIHSLGHGTGLEIHELPNLSPKSKDALLPGMVFSIEPGVYLPKIGGIRIEDLVHLNQTHSQRFIWVSTRLEDNILK